MKLSIKNCLECPLHHYDSESPISYCGLKTDTGYWLVEDKSDPIPDWCPLRKEELVLRLKMKIILKTAV